jgi:hypothetical protein
VPATMTHQMFALEVIKKSKSTFLSSHKRILTLATQGPDPFFFYGMLPWHTPKDAKDIQYMGEYFHKHDPQKHLHALYKQASLKQNDTLKAYAIGAIMHYILDKHVHPYVFSKSGFDASGKLSKPFIIYHSQLEVLMDVALLKHLSYKAKEVHPVKGIHIPNKSLEAIDQLYSDTYTHVCKEGWFKSSVKDMEKIYKFVYDGLGIKRRIFRLIFGKTGRPFVISHPIGLKHKENKDVLNLQHVMWRHPETGAPHDESVLDLFFRALDEMLLIMKHIESNTFDDTYILGDISYDGMHKDKVMTYQTMMFPIL